MNTSMKDSTRRAPRANRQVVVLRVLLVIACAGLLFAVTRLHRFGSTEVPSPVSSTRVSKPDTVRMARGSATIAASAAVIQLSASQIHQFGITFGSAEQRTLENLVRTVGAVVVDEATRSQVAPKFSGYAERLYVDRAGQHVARGDRLLEVYSPELLAAEQELLIAANLERDIGRSTVPGTPGAPINLLDAARRRLQLFDISDSQIDEILRTGRSRRTLTLYAAAPGVVLQKNVVQGQAIQQGQMLYDIADLSTVWVDVALREVGGADVRVGSTVAVQFAGYPGRSLAGHVAYVYPTLDSISRTLRARIEVANREGRLMPGMYATVAITTPSRAALTVPSSAVLRTGERTLVFVDVGNGRLKPQEIETGLTANDLTEVVRGLEPGQRVVTSAQFLLDSESNLAEVMKGMLGLQSGGDSGNAQNMKGMSMPPERR